MVKVEGAKNFGIGLGLIVEDALFAVRLDFTIFQVEIECEGSIFLHDDQVTVIDLGCPLTEQHAAGGNTVLLITMSIGHNGKNTFWESDQKIRRSGWSHSHCSKWGVWLESFQLLRL